jgi:hypothetical protein
MARSERSANIEFPGSGRHPTRVVERSNVNIVTRETRSTQRS